MAQVANMTYDSQVRNNIHAAAPNLGSAIWVSPTESQLGALQVKHIVRALYDASVAISQRIYERPGFIPQVYAGMFLRGQLIGNVKIYLRATALVDNKNATRVLDYVYDHHEANDTSFLGRAIDLNDTALADTGTLVDPRDPDFEIKYESTTGKCRLEDVWTAFLDGIATAAQHSPNESGAYVYGISESGECVVGIYQTLFNDLTWGHVRSTLLLLWRWYIWPGHRYNGLTFKIYNKGDEVGVGELLSLPVRGRTISSE